MMHNSLILWECKTCNLKVRILLFQFNSNSLSDWKDIEQLSSISTLQTVYFEYNPISRDPQYRRKLKLTIPSLTQIDATMIR